MLPTRAPNSQDLSRIFASAAGMNMSDAINIRKRGAFLINGLLVMIVPASQVAVGKVCIISAACSMSTPLQARDIVAS